MENQFLPYKQALELKELGFNEKCFGWWCWINGDKAMYYGYSCTNTELTDLNTFPNNCSAPLWQQAFDFFRSKHNALSIIFNDDGDVEYNNIRFNYEIRYITISFKEELKESVVGNYRYNTYEEVRLACIDKLIEIVKNEKTNNNNNT